MVKNRKGKHGVRVRQAVVQLPGRALAWAVRFWRRNWFHKLVVCLITLILLTAATMYGIARWYMWTQRDKPVAMGATFIAPYASSFGLDPKQTLDAMLTDLGIRQVRLVSYWNQIESTQGTYDFRDLDWQFEMANKHDAKVSLAIGLRQPRWPECHMPKWAESMPKDVWSAQLKAFMSAVIMRYKDNPALESYQLENEYFLKVFGICPDHSRDRLIDEYFFVKGLDPTTPVIISRSNNAIGFPMNEPTPDVFAVSVYKRVWDKTLTKRYVEYPFPAWFYGFLAGGGKLLTGKDLVIHELQAEPWPPEGMGGIQGVSIAEQDKSLSAERLRGRFEYGRATGIRSMDLWGAEYWYYRKVKLGDPSAWNVAKEEYAKSNARLAD